MKDATTLQNAVAALKRGGVIAYPTEAVYGLGCDPHNEKAVLKLLALKKRDVCKGLLLIAADFKQIAHYLAPVTHSQLAAALITWPGPFTWVFPATQHVPSWIRGDHHSVAVRVTAHPIAKQLCQAFGPLVSTSANVQHESPAMNMEQVEKIFPTGIDVIVPGALGDEAKPTQIRDVVTGKVLR